MRQALAGPARDLRSRSACWAAIRRRSDARGQRLAPARGPPLDSAARMESTVPPEPVGSVSPSEHQRHGPESSPTTAMGGRVLVLNATFEPINVCTVRRAVVLLLKEKAELLERGPARAALGDLDDRAAGGDPAGDLREGAARRPPAQDHPPGGVRPRQLDLPVLRLALQPDGRPRDPALQGGLLELGEHRRLVRSLQPAQGRPHCRARRACTPATPPAHRGRRSSSTSQARRSRRLGCSTCPRRPSLRTRRRPAPSAAGRALPLGHALARERSAAETHEGRRSQATPLAMIL